MAGCFEDQGILWYKSIGGEIPGGINPYRPNDFAGWLILIALGIPLGLLLEWIGGFIFSKELGQKISSKPFSVGRIIYASGAFLLFFAFLFFS